MNAKRGSAGKGQRSGAGSSGKSGGEGKGAPIRILHLHSTFDAGGKERRAVRLMNAFGPTIEHTVVSALPNRLAASQEVQRQIQVRYRTDFEALSGWPTLGRLSRLAYAMKPFDLVLTYNWGAMDAVMAHTLFQGPHELPPLIHHEDGFNEDEAHGRKWRRTWYRRIALGRAAGLVVPSETLEAIALDEWAQPIGRVKRIPNGIATDAFERTVRPDALPRLVKRPGELWLGTLAGLRAVKDLPVLVRALATLPEEWQLVLAGEGPEEDAIRAEADRLELTDRVHLPGRLDPVTATGLMDIFVLSSRSEQFPLSVVEAMAAGLPVAAPAVGDIADIVAAENAPFIVAPGDEGALADAIARLAADPALRRRVGAANRAKAGQEFDERAMIAAYRRLYASAMGRQTIP